MNFKSVIIVLAAVIAGTLGGAVTYQMAVPAGSAEPTTNESIVLDSPAKKARQERRQQARQVRFAPCKPPAELEGKRCVTDVVRTVVVPGQSSAQTAPVAAQSAPRSATPVAPAPAPASASGSDWNDDGRGDDSGYDDDDDDSGHGGGDDDDTDTGTHTNTGTGGGTQTRTRTHD